MSARVAILVPVLGRPERAEILAASVAQATDEPYTLLFLCSQGDDAEIAACQLAGDTIVMDFPAGPGDYARKINAGYRATTEPWIFTGADDLAFHPGWFTEAMKVYGETARSVVGTNDGWNGAVLAGKHSTHTLIERLYVDEHGASWDGPGVVFHEGYDHQYVDTEMVAVANQRQQFAFAKDSLVEHLHPFAQKSKMDATYTKGLARGREDGRLFHERRHVYLSA